MHARESALAAVYEGPRAITIREFPVPEVGEDDAVIEVLVAGVDGSDIHMFRGELPEINELAPVILGDEMVGRVVRIGRRARDERQLDVGDRVVIESKWPCHRCGPCQAGQYYLCERGWQGHGYGWTSINTPPHLWGSYATHVYVPEQALTYRVPDEMSLETAIVAASVFANGLRWVHEGGVRLGDPVAVIGPGPQGLSLTLAASLAGARVVTIGTQDDVERLSLAREWGALDGVVTSGKPKNTAQDATSLLGEEPRVVFETAGTVSALSLATELVARMGTIVIVSLTHPSPIPLDLNALLFKEAVIKRPLAHPYFVEKSLKLADRLQATPQDPGRLVSHSFGLDAVNEALLCAAYETNERPLKVVLRP